MINKYVKYILKTKNTKKNLSSFYHQQFYETKKAIFTYTLLYFRNYTNILFLQYLRIKFHTNDFLGQSQKFMLQSEVKAQQRSL